MPHCCSSTGDCSSGRPVFQAPRIGCRPALVVSASAASSGIRCVDFDLDLDGFHRRSFQAQRFEMVTALAGPTPLICSARVSVSGLYCRAMTRNTIASPDRVRRCRLSGVEGIPGMCSFLVSLRVDLGATPSFVSVLGLLEGRLSPPDLVADQTWLDPRASGLFPEHVGERSPRSG